jgi:tetratricopeptide (TPR) repeat protein
LARVLSRHFLQGARALKHFQDAFKLDSTLGEALTEARGIYWELGKLGMVKRLLELQIQRASSQAEMASLLIELGDVATDQGELEVADQAYQRAIEAAGADAVEASERLRDLRVDASDWRDRVQAIQEHARTADPAERATSLVRAARVARRVASEDADQLLEQAYSADPMRDDTATLYEGLLVSQAQEARVVQTQRGLIQATQDPNRQAELALRFGARWGHRHKKPQIAAEFGEETLRHQPRNEAAFALLCDVYGSHFGDWSKVVGLADTLGSQLPPPDAAFYLANAAAVAQQELGDPAKAQTYYERLAQIAPEQRHARQAHQRRVSDPAARWRCVEQAGSGAARADRQWQHPPSLTGGGGAARGAGGERAAAERCLASGGFAQRAAAPSVQPARSGQHCSGGQ